MVSIKCAINKESILDAQKLRSLVCYDSRTGSITWRANRGGGVVAGAVAGYLHSTGYVVISVNNINYLAHRLAWLYLHGVWPHSQIDHINGKRNDNRLANLRLATGSENHQNLRGPLRSNKHSKFLGVSRFGDRWRARIKINKKEKYLGLFDTQELAHAAYLDAKALFHPFGTLNKESESE